MVYFEEDVENNRMFLSIITSTMSLLNKHYPEYISRYSSETTMIVDSSSYNMSRQTDLHLHSFSQNPQVVNLARSVWWTKYHYQLKKIKERKILSLFLFIILYFIQILIILSTLPFFFPT